MKSIRIVLTVLAAAFILDGAAAYGTDKYFSPNSPSKDWDNATAAWRLTDCDTVGFTSAPTADDRAIICDDKTVNVNIDSAVADSIDVRGTGKINIEAAMILTLDGSDSTASTVTGTIDLEGSASELAITSNNLSFSGSGSIVGKDDAAKISIATSRTFTSAIEITGRMLINGAGSFQNNGLVHANVAGGTLDICPEDVVDDSTTPGDRWKVSTDSGAVLKFNSAIGTLNELDGNFVVDAGTMDIDKAMAAGTMITDGQLDMSGGIFDANVDVTFNNLDSDSLRADIDGGKIVMAAGELFTHK